MNAHSGGKYLTFSSLRFLDLNKKPDLCVRMFAMDVCFIFIRGVGFLDDLLCARRLKMPSTPKTTFTEPEDSYNMM